MKVSHKPRLVVYFHQKQLSACVNQIVWRMKNLLWWFFVVVSDDKTGVFNHVFIFLTTHRLFGTVCRATPPFTNEGWKGLFTTPHTANLLEKHQEIIRLSFSEGFFSPLIFEKFKSRKGGRRGKLYVRNYVRTRSILLFICSSHTVLHFLICRWLYWYRRGTLGKQHAFSSLHWRRAPGGGRAGKLELSREGKLELRLSKSEFPVPTLASEEMKDCCWARSRFVISQITSGDLTTGIFVATAKEANDLCTLHLSDQCWLTDDGSVNVETFRCHDYGTLAGCRRDLHSKFFTQVKSCSIIGRGVMLCCMIAVMNPSIAMRPSLISVFRQFFSWSYCAKLRGSKPRSPGARSWKFEVLISIARMKKNIWMIPRTGAVMKASKKFLLGK